MLCSRYLPPPVGLAVADLIAGLLVRFRPHVYRVVWANLRQVLGPEVGEEQLHLTVRRVFRDTARTYYELWHLVARGEKAISAAVHFPAGSLARVEEALQQGRGVIVVGSHVGNFDLGILALAASEPMRGRVVQVLGLGEEPAGGFALMDRMRTQAGIEMTPVTVPALRQAIRHLRAGGVVLTGVDRPVRETLPEVEFFGRLAPLPTGHIRLALRTDVPVLVANMYRTPEGRNVASICAPLEMIRTGDPGEELQINLRRVTELLEAHIRAYPDQWKMFVPVWPEL